MHRLILSCGCHAAVCLALAFGALADDVAEIHIKARSGFKFDPVRLRVDPGARVRLTFENADQMMHNLAVVKPGTREDVVKAVAFLGGDAARRQFIPDTDAVLHATRVLEPGQRQTLEFVAPKEAGVYPYVCTYPGHGFAMYGALYVTRDDLPPAKDDPHLPPPLPSFAQTGARFLHPHHGAIVVREFMPNCGPAAIAVGFANGESACWDAGQCRFRYAWSGGFISIPYRKHDQATVLGDVYYREPVDAFPLSIGTTKQTKPKVEFLGYRLVDTFPVFEYRVDGHSVYEALRPRAEGAGLTRTFAIDSAGQDVRFRIDQKLKRLVTASAGKWNDDVLHLTAAQAKRFTITIVPPDPFAEDDEPATDKGEEVSQ